MSEEIAQMIRVTPESWEKERATVGKFLTRRLLALGADPTSIEVHHASVFTEEGGLLIEVGARGVRRE